MSATAAKQRAPKVTVTVEKRPIVESTSYDVTSVEARVGRRSLRPEIKRYEGRTIRVPRYSEGVSVYLAEWDRERSAVYLGIYSNHRDTDGDEYEGAFEEGITPKQLDDLIELLIAARAKARELGIMSPRRVVPKAKLA